MILADTSIWIDHFKLGIAALQQALDRRTVLMHPLVLGELAVGNFRDRKSVLRRLQSMPQATRVSDYLVLHLIDGHHLHGLGLSYGDVHLLAAARVEEAPLWTRDKRLKAAAERLGIAAELA